MADRSRVSAEQSARELFAALNRHDLDAMAERQHPEVVEDFVVVGTVRGRAEVRRFFAELFGAFPDFTMEVVDVVADDANAVVQWQATATFSGTPFQGVHATGRPVSIRGCDVMVFENGLLRHNTVYYDGLRFGRQVGLLPREGSTADKAMTAAFNKVTDLRGRLRRDRRDVSDDR